MIWWREGKGRGKQRKRPSFLKRHSEAVSSCNLPCGFFGSGRVGVEKAEKACSAFGEFCTDHRRIHGLAGIKAPYSLSPHSCAPSPARPQVLWVVLGAQLATQLNKQGKSGLDIWAAASFLLYRPPPKAFIINGFSKLRKVQRPGLLSDLQFSFLQLFFFTPKGLSIGTESKGAFS